MFRFLLTLILLANGEAMAARDATHYPRDSAGQSAEYLGTYKGVYKDVFVLKLQTRVDPSFNNAQKTIIGQAMETLLERAVRPEVLDCAYRASTKDFPK